MRWHQENIEENGVGEGTQTKIVGKKKTRETIVSLLSW